MLKNQTGFSYILPVIIIAVIGAVGLVVWNANAGETKPTSSNTTQTNTNDSLSITRSSQGGVSGAGDGKDFTISNSQLKFKDQLKSLSKDQTAEIVQDLDAAHFFSLKDAYTCSGCADQLTTKLDVQIGKQSKTITFDTSSDAPSDLIKLDSYLLSLAP